MAISCPVFAGDWRGLGAIARVYRRGERAVRRYWQQEVYVRACLALADRRAAGRSFRPWQVELDTRVTCIRDGLISLVQELRDSRGHDAPKLIVRRGDTWSLADGAPVSLASLCPGRGWKRRLLEQMERQANERIQSGESLLDADCPSKLRRRFDPAHFCLTEGGLEVFYPMCEIAAAGEGIAAFELSLGELQSSGGHRKRHGKSAASSA